MPTSGAQDLPPSGGFSEIPYKRNLPKRGPPGWVLLSGVTTVILVGFILHAKGNRIRLELEREKRQARLYMTPLLLAELDLNYLRKVERSRAAEAEIMKNDPNWIVGEKVYNTDRYIRQNIFIDALPQFLSKG